MHSGGIVPGLAGQEVFTVLEGGERVTSRQDVASGDRPIVLVIEGRPFTAMIAEHENEQVAALMAGAR
jgi:hypothetical protein